ncbi:MAG: RNA-binding protein [Caulobacteraceae bacterium]
MAEPSPVRSTAERGRRDIVSGAVMEEGRLIRFVAAPGGGVAPDLARKLPGRGLWVAADRRSVEMAARKGLFARAAKAPVAASPDLADQVAALLARRLLSALGLARKAGALTFGFAKVLASIEAGTAAHLIEAADGAVDGRRKLLAAFRRTQTPPRLTGLFSSDELGLALGADNVIHTAFLAGRGADRWTVDVERLSGFRSLIPESWRED